MSVPLSLVITLFSSDGVVAFFKKNVHPYKDRIVYIKHGTVPVPGFKFISTPGHTPDHMSILMESNGESMLVVGDSFTERVSFRHSQQCLQPRVLMISLTNVGIHTCLRLSICIGSRPSGILSGRCTPLLTLPKR